MACRFWRECNWHCSGSLLQSAGEFSFKATSRRDGAELPLQALLESKPLQSQQDRQWWTLTGHPWTHWKRWRVWLGMYSWYAVLCPFCGMMGSEFCCSSCRSTSLLLASPSLSSFKCWCWQQVKDKLCWFTCKASCVGGTSQERKAGISFPYTTVKQV